jgi:hypothetical protein
MIFTADVVLSIIFIVFFVAVVTGLSLFAHYHLHRRRRNFHSPRGLLSIPQHHATPPPPPPTPTIHLYYPTAAIQSPSCTAIITVE